MGQPGVAAAAAERARWLGELAHAIEEAQQLASKLRATEASSAEIEELFRRIAAARVEIEALRRGGWRTGAVEIGPLWASLLNRIVRPG